MAPYRQSLSRQLLKGPRIFKTLFALYGTCASMATGTFLTTLSMSGPWRRSITVTGRLSMPPLF